MIKGEISFTFVGLQAIMAALSTYEDCSPLVPQTIIGRSYRPMVPPPGGGGGTSIIMYAYWVCAARETPIFSPEFPFRSI